MVYICRVFKRRFNLCIHVSCIMGLRLGRPWAVVVVAQLWRVAPPVAVKGRPIFYLGSSLTSGGHIADHSGVLSGKDS